MSQIVSLRPMHVSHTRLLETREEKRMKKKKKENQIDTKIRFYRSEAYRCSLAAYLNRKNCLLT